MTAEHILSAMGSINQEAVRDARAYKRDRFRAAAKWGAMAACFVLILTAAAITLPGIIRGRGDVVLPPESGASGIVDSSNNTQPATEPVQPPSEPKTIINWENVVVNESEGMTPGAARRYYSSDLYNEEILDTEGVRTYYGWELAPTYIPDGLTGGGKDVSGCIVREKATGNIVEEQAGRSFWVDFWEDGSPKSNDDIVIPKGFTIRASKLRILHCCLLPVDGERTTDFGGVPVTLAHCSMAHGPYDPTRKAPDGLSNMPAGYYDVYTASFELDGVKYEVEAQRLELEEVIKIVASVISGASSEDFVVGNP